MARSRTLRPRVSLILVVGVLFSFGLGIYLYRVDADKTSGLVCGLLSLVITLLLELFSKFSQLSHVVSGSVHTLTVYAARPPWLYRLVDDCVEFVDEAFSTFQDDMIHQAAQRLLETCRDELDELRRGHIRTTSTDKRLSLLAIQRTTRRLRAVSIVSIDLATWYTPSGERYLSENKLAAQRGVAIERIFVYEGSKSDDLMNVVRRLTFPNSRVLLLDSASVPLDKRTDMVIFDDSFAVETRTNASGQFVDNVFTARPSDIQRQVAAFEFLKGLAEECAVTTSLHAVRSIGGDAK